MTESERKLRSRIAKLVSQEGLVRGTLQVRDRTCGKPNCRCAKGDRHKALYLVVSKDGKQQQLYIPKAYEERVRQWVASYKHLRESVKELTEIYLEQIRRRE